MKLMSVQQCIVINQIIRLVYKLFGKYFTLSNYSLLNEQLSVRKVEHELHRSCATIVRHGKRCVTAEELQKLHSAR